MVKNIKTITKTIRGQIGFTFTEIIIYIGVISIISVMVVSLIVQLVQLKHRASSMSIISSEASNLFEKIINDMRNCDDFILVDDSTLQVVQDTTTIEFRLQDTNVFVTEGENSYQLTTNQVKITQLHFIDWTSVNSDDLLHIEVEIERGGINEKFQTSVHKR